MKQELHAEKTKENTDYTCQERRLKAKMSKLPSKVPSKIYTALLLLILLQFFTFSHRKKKTKEKALFSLVSLTSLFCE